MPENKKTMHTAHNKCNYSLFAIYCWRCKKKSNNLIIFYILHTVLSYRYTMPPPLEFYTVQVLYVLLAIVQLITRFLFALSRFSINKWNYHLFFIFCIDISIYNVLLVSFLPFVHIFLALCTLSCVNVISKKFKKKSQFKTKLKSSNVTITAHQEQ